MFKSMSVDGYLKSFTDKLFPFFNIQTYQAKLEFAGHFLGHAAGTLFILSFPFKWSWIAGLSLLVWALVRELIMDKHYKDLFAKTEKGKDARTDLFSRGLGSVLPYLILLWK
jgi:hypothetical protein